MQTALFSSTIWILALLFGSFLVVGLFGNKMKPTVAGAISTLAILIAAIISYSTAYLYFFKEGLVDGVYQIFIPYQQE